MSLLPWAGQQRRDKVTYPAPCPQPRISAVSCLRSLRYSCGAGRRGSEGGWPGRLWGLRLGQARSRRPRFRPFPQAPCGAGAGLTCSEPPAGSVRRGQVKVGSVWPSGNVCCHCLKHSGWQAPRSGQGADQEMSAWTNNNRKYTR